MRICDIFLSWSLPWDSVGVCSTRNNIRMETFNMSHFTSRLRDHFSLKRVLSVWSVIWKQLPREYCVADSLLVISVNTQIKASAELLLQKICYATVLPLDPIPSFIGYLTKTCCGVLQGQAVWWPGLVVVWWCCGDTQLHIRVITDQYDHMAGLYQSVKVQ